MMGLARPKLAKVPDIGFWKLCGSGTGEGFTPVPNTAVYAILATWPDLKTAQVRMQTADIFARYRARASEDYTLFLSPVSARGAWAGVAPFQPERHSNLGPVAALTRATVNPVAALKFWRRVPDISSMIGQDPNVAFKIGIGEIPLLHQITFSVWPDTKVMAEFARVDGPHARAITAVREEDWFREELYARFRILDRRGTWEGDDPLAHLEMTV